MKKIIDKRSFKKWETYDVDCTMMYPLAVKYFEKPELIDGTIDEEADFDICTRDFTIETIIKI